MVYSVTARATFERIEKFRNQILRVQDRDDVPMVLIGNKVDRAPQDREVSTQEAEALARQLGCQLSAFGLQKSFFFHRCHADQSHQLLAVETSAKTRYNLEDAYYNVVRIIRSTSKLAHWLPVFQVFQAYLLTSLFLSQANETGPKLSKSQPRRGAVPFCDVDVLRGCVEYSVSLGFWDIITRARARLSIALTPTSTEQIPLRLTTSHDGQSLFLALLLLVYMALESGELRCQRLKRRKPQVKRCDTNLLERSFKDAAFLVRTALDCLAIIKFLPLRFSSLVVL